jgi:hypothetical protein
MQPKDGARVTFLDEIEFLKSRFPSGRPPLSLGTDAGSRRRSASASTLTYRKRACERLGISSQNELFSISRRLRLKLGRSN